MFFNLGHGFTPGSIRPRQGDGRRGASKECLKLNVGFLGKF
ncbi:MAG: hypothetical protein CM1200mP18_15060 [Gammaproteobacteria bacterium]|nr:MAG: hypothetical protein CM1200mP18_15060 [Gammaproteobacteria bacterium]